MATFKHLYVPLLHVPSIYTWILSFSHLLCPHAAGYRMMCVTNAPLCRRVTLRHCLALVGLTTLLPVCDVTTWWLPLTSLPLNVWNTHLGYQFYKDSDSRSARKLFRFSLLYLPILMLMIMFHIKPRTEQEETVVQVTWATLALSKPISWSFKWWMQWKNDSLDIWPWFLLDWLTFLYGWYTCVVAGSIAVWTCAASVI